MKNEFVIRIVEELATTVIIRGCDTIEEAIDKAQKLHENGEIILDYDDFSDVEIEESATDLKTAKYLKMPVFE